MNCTSHSAKLKLVSKNAMPKGSHEKSGRINAAKECATRQGARLASRRRVVPCPRLTNENRTTPDPLQHVVQCTLQSLAQHLSVFPNETPPAPLMHCSGRQLLSNGDHRERLLAHAHAQWGHLEMPKLQGLCRPSSCVREECRYGKRDDIGPGSQLAPPETQQRSHLPDQHHSCSLRWRESFLVHATLPIQPMYPCDLQHIVGRTGGKRFCMGSG
mmetsp:Transcript_18557/g.36410  ORF Transcript_18557/g.36410 Transcript_18557/m.36410 type:complete len:215 (-) Transcript_18557:438-1082(-)